MIFQLQTIIFGIILFGLRNKMYIHNNKMTSEYNKKRSIDLGDLLAQRKRNLINQVNQSQQNAGTYKPNLSERSFEKINIQRQIGLDSELTPNLPAAFKLFPPRFFRRG